MQGARRKELMAEYKERKPRPGVFVVRCATTGEAWTGASPDLDKAQNGLWFGLRTGSYVNKPLQAAWNAAGADAFSFEELEAIDAEGLSRLGLKDRLKDAEAAWRQELSAHRLAP